MASVVPEAEGTARAPGAARDPKSQSSEGSAGSDRHEAKDACFRPSLVQQLKGYQQGTGVLCPWG